MKNIEKKWLLFTIATVVTTFGIGYTLLKGTSATTDTSVVLESTGFEDINFYRCVVEQYNKDNDTDYNYMVDILSDEQLKNISRLSCFANGDIVSIVGIEKLSLLTMLDMHSNKLTAADLSNNIALTSVRLSSNQLTDLDLSNNINITDLELRDNRLTEIDVSKNINLEYFEISDNQLTNIDVSENTNLEYLESSYNELTDLNLNNNIILKYLDVSDNQLTDIDVSKNTNLEYLNVSSNQLTDIDVSKNTNLVKLYVYGNQLTNLNVSSNTELIHLYVGDSDFGAGGSYEGNLLTEINLENNSKLQYLSVAMNQLTSLDVSNNKELIELVAYNNLLTEINLENNTKLERLSLGVTYGCSSASGGLACSRKYGNSLTQLDVSNNINLTKLYVSNNKLTNLDLSKNNKLENVQVGNNELTNLILTGCTNLSVLVVSDNNLSSLDLSNLTNIGILYVENNKLIDLDLSNQTMLSYAKLNSNLYSKELYAYKGSVINLQEYNDVLILADDKETTLSSVTTEETDVTIEGTEIKSDVGGTYNVTGVYQHDIQTSYNTYEVQYTFNVIEATSKKYVINEEENYIYIGSDTEDEISKNISLNHGKLDTKDNKVLIKNEDDDVLKEFITLSIDFGELNEVIGFITLNESITYETFTNNITTSDEITYEIFESDTKVTGGNISSGMILKVYYDGKELTTYNITEDYFEFDNDIKVDDTDMVVSNIVVGTDINDILDSNGDIQILDKDGNIIEDTNYSLRTGDKIRMTFPSQVLEFTLSINGDISGDGDITNSDIEMLSKHIVRGDVITGNEYLLASDYDDNDTIDINDVIKLAQYVRDNG